MDSFSYVTNRLLAINGNIFITEALIRRFPTLDFRAGFSQPKSNLKSLVHNSNPSSNRNGAMLSPHPLNLHNFCIV